MYLAFSFLLQISTDLLLEPSCLTRMQMPAWSSWLFLCGLREMSEVFYKASQRGEVKAPQPEPSLGGGWRPRPGAKLACHGARLAVHTALVFLAVGRRVLPSSQREGSRTRQR